MEKSVELAEDNFDLFLENSKKRLATIFDRFESLIDIKLSKSIEEKNFSEELRKLEQEIASLNSRNIELVKELEAVRVENKKLQNISSEIINSLDSCISKMEMIVEGNNENSKFKDKE